MNFINVRQNKNVFADGEHDDTDALQACIDSVRDGGTVYFPDGIYPVSSPLIFYSNQTFRFSDNAILLRSDKSEHITKYLLAAYSESSWTGYGGTHDVVISGGTFDGNANLTEKLTLINTVHCSNITVENACFFHCAHWHFIELNSTSNAVVKNCFFNGPTYTAVSDILYNEQIQIDVASEGCYGPVYKCDGSLIDFALDDTPCRDIVITSNIFKCAGFPSVGHHCDSGHHNIEISNNIFDGPAGLDGKSRGYIFFRPSVYDVRVINNVFIAPENITYPNIGVISENPDENALTLDNNSFIGSFTRIVRHG